MVTPHSWILVMEFSHCIFLEQWKVSIMSACNIKLPCRDTTNRFKSTLCVSRFRYCTMNTVGATTTGVYGYCTWSDMAVLEIQDCMFMYVRQTRVYNLSWACLLHSRSIVTEYTSKNWLSQGWIQYKGWWTMHQGPALPLIWFSIWVLKLKYKFWLQWAP